MNARTSSALLAAALIAIGLASIAAPASAAANSVADLTGRWSGWGNVVMTNGSTEQVKCVVTYFVNGPEVKQNLRCASTTYKIDSVAKLSVVNGQVTGDWEEKTYSATGQIAGKLTGTGMSLSIAGPTFSAAMALSTSGCKQSINITPTGTDVSRISIGLGRC